MAYNYLVCGFTFELPVSCSGVVTESTTTERTRSQSSRRRGGPWDVPTNLAKPVQPFDPATNYDDDDGRLVGRSVGRWLDDFPFYYDDGEDDDDDDHGVGMGQTRTFNG